MADEKGLKPVEREWWTRNVRGIPEKPGPWHLVKKRADRSYGWSAAAECGFQPDYSHQRCDDRPTQGKFCPKCLRAAEARLLSPEQPIPRVVLERMRERTDDPAALTEIERRLAKEGEA